MNLPSLPSLPLERRKELPDIAAVYFVLQGVSVLYIGQARHLKVRWSIHHRLQEFQQLRGLRIAWLETPVGRLRAVEKHQIDEWKPRLNGSQVQGAQDLSTVAIPNRTRQRAVGAGRPKHMKDPARLHVFIERADMDALEALGGDKAEHVRAALHKYLESVNSQAEGSF